MKIGEALQEINSLKGVLDRLHKTRQKLFSRPKNTVPEKNFYDVSDEIKSTLKKINTLKLRISQRNHVQNITIVESDDITTHCTLMEAILKVGIYRSELAQLTELNNNDYSFNMSRRETDPYIPITPNELEKQIRELERLKRVYDHAIQGINWSVDI